MNSTETNKMAYAIDCIKFYSGNTINHPLRSIATTYNMLPGEALRIDALAFEIIKGYELPI